jgi:hypothetical protein
VQLAFDLPVWPAVGAQEDDAGSQNVALRRGAFPDHGLQPFPVTRPQAERGSGIEWHDRTSMFVVDMPIIGYTLTKAPP